MGQLTVFHDSSILTAKGMEVNVGNLFLCRSTCLNLLLSLPQEWEKKTTS